MGIVKLKLYVLFVFSYSFVFAQDITIRKIDTPIQIDGVMEEAVWQKAEIAENFHQYFPFDTSAAEAPTQVRLLYDDNFLYVYAIMHNLGPREYVVPSLRRDFRGAAFDNITVILDTYKDKTNAFSFGMNPYGVRREGLIAEGGNTSGSSGNSAFSLTWDNKWFGEAKIYENYWAAEMAIPFKSIRYQENSESWYINFYRVDSKDGERSTWSPIPRNFSVVNIGFNKEAKWEEPLTSPGKNISLIPFIAMSSSKNFEEQEEGETKVTVGGDAKIALSPSLNLDLTINPDFSQVEVDQQVTNLDRFEIFFPEQRQFFLENADLFGNFGTRGARPFFSRRIGIARDTATGTNLSNPLYFGGRMSGNLGNKWRIGVMSIQAAEEDDIGLPTTNYSVASVQNRIGPRSNVAAFLVSKQAFQDSIGGKFNLGDVQGNRTVGLDLNLATSDNKWSGKGYYHATFDGTNADGNYSYGVSANYQTNEWQINTDHRAVGDAFNPEVGFVRRTGFDQYRWTSYYNFYPGKGIIQSHAPGFDFDILRTNDYGLTDWDMNILYRINFKNTARFNMRLRRQYTYLFNAFDPSGTDGIALGQDTEYTYNFVIANFESDKRKNFFYEISTRSGKYFNGNRINFEGEISYRFIPRAITSLNFEYNRIRLPDPYNDANLILIGPRIDITFTKNIFWTTFIQYNNQIDNLNINSRFQWRYNPVSDLFIVYSDNYFAVDIDNRFVDFRQPKLRSFIVKLTYWFNP